MPKRAVQPRAGTASLAAEHAPSTSSKVTDSKDDGGVRTAMVTGAFGVAGTLLTCLVTWSLNRFDRPSTPAPATQIAVPVASTMNRQVKPILPERPLAPRPPAYEALIHASPISFADWQAMVREKFTYEQRKSIFGDDLGKRVTWLGVFDQFNLITLATATRDDAYILVIFESEVARNTGPLRPAPALCHFPAIAKRQLDQLRVGQRVVVSGTLANPELTGQLLGTELQACELVSVLGE